MEEGWGWGWGWGAVGSGAYVGVEARERGIR
jgi:hypothetical protein